MDTTHTFRTALTTAAVLLVTGCAVPSDDHATAARSIPQQQHEVDVGATYDGWAVRRERGSSPPACPYSPDQVQAMREAGRPMPHCVRRLQRWFRDLVAPAGRR